MNQSRENRDICGENLSSRTEDYRGHCGVSFFLFFFLSTNIIPISSASFLA